MSSPLDMLATREPPELEPQVVNGRQALEGKLASATARAGIRWLLFFLAIYPFVAMWSVTNPMFASPDENLHMIRAQAFAQLDFSDTVATDGLPVESVDCYAFQPEVPASCRELAWGPDGTLRVARMDGYPPLFHAVAAIPATMFSGLVGAYLMRLWMGAVCVGLVAWGGALVTRPGAGRWPLAGMLLAMTPMTIFAMGTVSPSGMASAGAILMVSAVLALSSGTDRIRRTLVPAAVGALVLMLTRRDGVVWLAVLAIVLSPLAPWSRLKSMSKEAPRSRVALIAATSAVFLLIATVVVSPTVMRFYGNWRDGMGQMWWDAARNVRLYLVQAVGVFGWLDSPLGDEGFLVVMVASGALVVLGMAARRPPLVLSTALGVAMLLVTPVLFSIARFPYLQGRYLLPIWAGLLLVAGAATADAGLPRRVSRRLVGILVGVWLLTQGLGAVQNLRRYAVGRSGPWSSLFDSAAWHPKTMSNSVAVAGIVVSLAVAGVLLRVLLAGASLGESDFFGQPPRHSIEDRPPDHQADE